MAIGPGKYDGVCTTARMACGPRAEVALIVLEGGEGPGFSVQASVRGLTRLPEILRRMADDIDQDLRGEGAAMNWPKIRFHALSLSLIVSAAIWFYFVWGKWASVFVGIWLGFQVGLYVGLAENIRRCIKEDRYS